ncbi:hypothetical protein [Falsibacillus albus]|uniref:DUF4367 domain-containing protein n=1 Tax=Falsibacillus albus TaxID=2478915 RepID=A0A3L7K478_9BACI|nr:hypothetical protein [Falsibacillus albus]RLQ97896.1 hypothetical protein D9X91_00435 [Falsibacillus albus]
MKKSLIIFIVAISALFALTGCNSSSIKVQAKDAQTRVQKSFKAEPKKAGETLKKLKIHLPFGMSVKKEAENNVILKKGSNTYILFYNPKESAKSELVYQMTKKQSKSIYKEFTFKDKKRFGYLIINKIKKDYYEVSVGIGGIKLTTETKTSHVASEAEMMMDIVSSATYKK